MSSTLSATSIVCSPGLPMPCFSECMDYLTYQPTSETTVDFRPYFSTVTEHGILCNCSNFNVYGAIINDGNTQAQGSSPGGSPFLSAVLMASSNLVNGRFFLATSQICTVYYEVTGGPSVLGVGYSYFYLWWVILVSCMFFCCCCCIFARFCCLRGEQAGKTLGPPPPNHSNPPPVDEPESTFVELPAPQYAPAYVFQNNIPMATAVPVTSVLAETEMIPTADEVKNGSSNNDRQVALV